MPFGKCSKCGGAFFGEGTKCPKCNITDRPAPTNGNVPALPEPVVPQETTPKTTVIAQGPELNTKASAAVEPPSQPANLPPSEPAQANGNGGTDVASPPAQAPPPEVKKDDKKEEEKK